MKCVKCKSVDAVGGKYCKPCGAQYMKEYRARKIESMNVPIETKSETVEAPRTPYVEPKHVPINLTLVNPLYMSYYVTKESKVHKEMIEAERLMNEKKFVQPLSGTP